MSVHFGQSRSFSENAHNSWTAWYILIKFCILIHFNIIITQVFKTLTRLYQEKCCSEHFFHKSKELSRITLACLWVGRIGHLISIIETCTAHNVERTTHFLEIENITPNITLNSTLFQTGKNNRKNRPSYSKSDMYCHFQICNHNL